MIFPDVLQIFLSSLFNGFQTLIHFGGQDIKWSKDPKIWKTRKVGNDGSWILIVNHV